MRESARSEVIQNREPIRILLMNEVIRLADISEALASNQRIQDLKTARIFIFVSGFKIVECNRAF